VILQVFGLWLPPAKGRSGTPAVATKSWYKKKKTFKFLHMTRIFYQVITSETSFQA